MHGWPMAVLPRTATSEGGVWRHHRAWVFVERDGWLIALWSGDVRARQLSCGLCGEGRKRGSAECEGWGVECKDV